MINKLNSWNELNTQNSKNSKNRINKYVLAFSIAAATIVWFSSEKVSATRINNSLENSELSDRNSVTQLNDTKELIGYIWNFFSESNIELNNIELNELYEKYLSSNLWPNTRIYIKNLLLNAYIEILKSWYTVRWYKDLDELISKIDELSDWKIEIRYDKSMPENSEFKETINIEWEIIWDRINISKKWMRFWFTSSSNNLSLNIDNKQLLWIFLSDIPNSLKESLDKISELSKIQMSLSQELRIYKNNIWLLEFQLEQLREQNRVLELEYNNSIIEINNQKKSALEENQRVLENTIKNLEETQAAEIDKLNKDIEAKNTEIIELRRAHTEELNNIRANHTTEIKRIEDRENNRIIRLQESFNQERNKLRNDILLLEEEQNNLRQLYEAQIETLNAQLTELRKDLDSISNQNINLNNQITTLNQVIERLGIDKKSISDELSLKKEELDSLIDEKNQLLWQINTVWWAKDLLLSQTQDSLRRSEALNNRLQTRISQLDSELTWLRWNINRLETENNRLRELESKSRDLVIALDEISQLNMKIEQLENQNTELINRNNRLTNDNEQFSTYREYLDKYNALLPKLEKANEDIKSLEDLIEKMKTDIGILERNNEWLNNSLTNQQRNNWVLLNQITELQKSFNDILSWKITISTESLAENLREKTEENQMLQQENQRLIREREEAIQNESNAKRELIRVQAEYAEKEDQIRREYEKKSAELIRELLLRR